MPIELSTHYFSQSTETLCRTISEFHFDDIRPEYGEIDFLVFIILESRCYIELEDSTTEIVSKRMFTTVCY